jgi:hypothetical protein
VVALEEKKNDCIRKSELRSLVSNRVARLYICRPKIQTLVHLLGPWSGSFWQILWPLGILQAVWHILWSFCRFCGHLLYIFPFWYVVTRKIWQPWRRINHSPHFHCALEMSAGALKLNKHLKVRETQVGSAGLPDFYWYKIPKRGKMYQITTKYA